MDEFVEVIEEPVVVAEEPAAVVVEEPAVVEESVIVEEPVIEEPVVEDEPIIPASPLYRVQVIHDSLRRRADYRLDSEVLGVITDKGIYNIYDQNSGWGKLEDGSWIKLEFTKRIVE